MKEGKHMKRMTALLVAAALLMGTAWAARAAGKKLIAITYDDGPGPYTENLLDELKARGVKATFFMVGNRVSSYRSAVTRAYREGHQIANHSYDHSDLTGLSGDGIRSQINTTNGILNGICGKGTSYMVRAPYGSVNFAVLRAAGAPLVLWSVDPQDWLYRNAETVKNNIIRNAHDGAIVLVHDIHPTSIPGSLAAIDYLKGQGYEFVTVRELFRRRGRSVSNGVQYGSCPAGGKDLGPVEAPAISAEPEGSKLRITIKAQPGTAVYYTTGSGELNQESARYTEPFLVDCPCTLRAAAAYNMNGSRSQTVTETFTMPKVQKPRLSISSGTLSIECGTPGAGIYYSLAGGEDLAYTGPVPVAPGTEITAYAACEGYLSSEQAWAVYSSRGNLFCDVRPDSWYYEDMDRAAAAGYLRGTGSGIFNPTKNVTRGELVTLLYRYSGETVEEPESMPFQDVTPDKYYAEPVAWAYRKGIVSGCGNHTFLPERSVSRQEMAKIIYNFLCCRQAVTEEDAAAGREQLASYADAGKVAVWAEEAVGYLSLTGLLHGTGKDTFQPRGNTTRAQAASVLVRLEDFLA